MTATTCPSWCTDKVCRGAHWTHPVYVRPAEDQLSGSLPEECRACHAPIGGLYVEQLGVALHQDAERVPENRDPATFSPQHVLLHIFGSHGGLDTEAHLTPGEARDLAELLTAGADVLDPVVAFR